MIWNVLGMIWNILGMIWNILERSGNDLGMIWKWFGNGMRMVWDKSLPLGQTKKKDCQKTEAQASTLDRE